MAHFIDDITHISKKYLKKINNSILPLHQLGINYLAIQTVTADGQWSIISSNPAWIEYSAGNQLFLYDPSLINPKHYESGVCFVDSHDHDDFRNIFCKHSEGVWDLGNALAIIEKKANECEFIFLSAGVKNKKIINTYLTKLKWIKKFSHYFKIQHESFFRQSIEYSVDLKNINPSYFKTDNIIQTTSEIEENTNLNYSYLFNILSDREKECIKHFFHGKTAKETALILNLSYRTIEEYFTNIKKKLGCKNKRDLLSIFL